MTERISANLPSRDFDATEAFYARLGFTRRFRDAGWMILARGDAIVEFFPHPGLDPRQSWFSACLRSDDLDGLYAAFRTVGLSEDPAAIPRLVAPMTQPGAPRFFAVVDEDGSLWRCLEMTRESTGEKPA